MSKFVTNLKAAILATTLIGYGVTVGFTVADSIVGGAVKAKVEDTKSKVVNRVLEKRNARIARAVEVEYERRNAQRSHEIHFSDDRRISPEMFDRLKKAPAMSMKDIKKRCVNE